MCEGHYESIQNNLETINELKKEAHDREMLIDEMDRRLQALEARIESIKRENDLTEFSGAYSGGLDDL